MKYYPRLVVFDLDACFWDQETFELDAVPNRTIVGDLQGRGTGVLGVDCGNEIMQMHPGALYALQNHIDGQYPETKVAFASSALTPFSERIARKALALLEVIPGTSVWDLVVDGDWLGKDVNQIGRQPPLSSNKAETHFPLLKAATGIRYDEMLFFDDCNWGDHCGMVSAACREPDTNRGPVTVRTPRGLQVEDWLEGLRRYEQQAADIQKEEL